MLFLGIDPGKSGGMAFTYDGLKEPIVYAFGKMTEMDIHKTIEENFIVKKEYIFAMLERVWAFPGQGVSSTWKFGQHYGFLRGILTANEIPFELVTPVKWQSAMGCLTKGDKNISKVAAQRLFPSIKITHAIADALLIMEHCRRTVTNRGTPANGNG